MTLAEALGVASDEVVALVGGGGKSTTMFRLAREIVERGGRVLSTTTTHIFAAQAALAPAQVSAEAATRDEIAAALATHRHVLIVGPTNAATNRTAGPSLERFRRLRGWFPDVCFLNEADGSRMRPFKAPAQHEPVIPPETTLVVPMIGADVLGQPLDAGHVHRPELVSALSAVPLGAPVTPEVVARVLTHREGGLKGVPEGAGVVVLINKVDRLPDRGPLRDTASRLLAEPRIRAVVLGGAQAPDPVFEIFR
jgi:molybdenum cofactor cytidylyltransferase